MSTGKNDTLFKDQDLKKKKKTLPYLAAYTNMAHIWEDFPRGSSDNSYPSKHRILSPMQG